MKIGIGPLVLRRRFAQGIRQWRVELTLSASHYYLILGRVEGGVPAHQHSEAEVILFFRRRDVTVHGLPYRTRFIFTFPYQAHGILERGPLHLVAFKFGPN